VYLRPSKVQNPALERLQQRHSYLYLVLVVYKRLGWAQGTYVFGQHVHADLG
jgi:hypothetical protein